MPNLESVLGQIPGLAGYKAEQQFQQERALNNVRAATGVAQVQQVVQQQRDREALREAAMASGGDLTKFRDALIAKGMLPQAEQALKVQQGVQEQQILSGMNGQALNDPDTLERLGIALRKPEFLSRANDLRKAKANEATYGAMRATSASPFAALMRSEIPAVASQATALHQQMMNADPRAIPAQHWMDQAQQLARMEATAQDRAAIRDAIAARALEGRGDWTEPYAGPRGTMLQQNRTTGEVRTVVGQAPLAVQLGGAGGTDGKFDADALKVAAWEKLLFGTDPKGMGTLSSQQRAQVANERARIGKELGLTVTEMAMMPQDNKVKMKAVDKLTTWGAFVDKAAEQVGQSLDVAIDYAKKLDPTTLRMVNRAVLAGRAQFNDPTQAGYAAAIGTVRREYGRLMSGPTSNAMLPVEAMKQADGMISEAMDVPALLEVKNVMLRDAGITRNSVKNQVDSLRGSITGAKPAEAPKPANSNGWSIRPK